MYPTSLFRLPQQRIAIVAEGLTSVVGDGEAVILSPSCSVAKLRIARRLFLHFCSDVVLSFCSFLIISPTVVASAERTELKSSSTSKILATFADLSSTAIGNYEVCLRASLLTESYFYVGSIAVGVFVCEHEVTHGYCSSHLHRRRRLLLM